MRKSVEARELFEGRIMITERGEFLVREGDLIRPEENDPNAGKFWVEGCEFDGLEYSAMPTDFYFEPETRVEVWCI